MALLCRPTARHLIPRVVCEGKELLSVLASWPSEGRQADGVVGRLRSARVLYIRPEGPLLRALPYLVPSRAQTAILTETASLAVRKRSRGQHLPCSDES